LGSDFEDSQLGFDAAKSGFSSWRTKVLP